MSFDSPLMRMTEGQMRYLTQRQSVLAQNIANIDTPGYQAKDLEKPNFFAMIEGESSRRIEMRTTSQKHLTGSAGGAGGFDLVTRDDEFALKPTGNGVVLEEEMAKISDTGAEYQISSALFKKYTQMMRSTLGK